MKTFLKAFLGFMVSLLVIFIALILGFNAFLSNNLSKREIFYLVDKNNETILADISENNFDDTLAIKGVTDVVRNDVTDIQCGGKGLGSATSYYGFYYCEADEPVVMFNGYISDAGTALISENNGYSFREKDSDNTYYTEKILPCFYYYEWHF